MTEAQLATTIAQAVAAAMGKKSLNKANPKRKAKGKKAKGREKPTEADKVVYMAENDAKCVAAFVKAGVADVKPRVNVLTYNKWVEKGRMVRKGEKSVKVGPFALFHENQTDVIQITATTEAANQVAA